MGHAAWFEKGEGIGCFFGMQVGVRCLSQRVGDMHGRLAQVRYKGLEEFRCREKAKKEGLSVVANLNVWGAWLT